MGRFVNIDVIGPVEPEQYGSRIVADQHEDLVDCGKAGHQTVVGEAQLGAAGGVFQGDACAPLLRGSGARHGGARPARRHRP